MDLRCDLRIRLNAEGNKSFGPGVAELLRLAEEKRSLSSAAREMGMAYSKAHRIVKACEEALGMKLMDFRTGGVNGGGASLTREGRELLRAYDGFCAEVRARANGVFEEYFSFLIHRERAQDDPLQL